MISRSQFDRGHSRFGRFVLVVVILVILGSLAAGITTVVFLVKGAKAIEQNGLKNTIERIWEGPNGQ